MKFDFGLFFRLTAALSLGGIGGSGFAGEATPNLPPAEIVARVLLANPSVQAASGQIRVEEANRDRLEAGHYEWNIHLGAQQRRSAPTIGPDERFNEWNAAIERPLRLPGKGSLDSELGAAGVALAETAHGDALHENSRNLLKSWFVWLKESAAEAQWTEQFALLEKQGKAVQRRQQLGDAARLETILAEAAQSQAEAQLAQARVRQQNASEDLRRRYPGLPLVTGAIAEPVPIEGNETDWINAILEHSHELELARGDTADAALAQADVAGRREAAATQKISAESAMLYQSAKAAFASWQASRTAAERQSRAAEMTARAYQLGEGSLNDLLAARRLANEAQLSARLMQLDALELRYRLLLDAHQLWAMD